MEEHNDIEAGYKDKNIKFTYLRQPPKRYTFEMPELYKWTIQNCKQVSILNLFAGKVKLFDKSDKSYIETRVDLNKEMVADYYMDAYEYVLMAKQQGLKYDTIVFDPPYNLRKSREKYKGIYTSELRKIKTVLPDIVTTGGIVLSYGYDSVGMGRQRGFNLIHVCLICHGGDHNDTIAISEKKIQANMIFDIDTNYELKTTQKNETNNKAGDDGDDKEHV